MRGGDRVREEMKTSWKTEILHGACREDTVFVRKRRRGRGSGIGDRICKDTEMREQNGFGEIRAVQSSWDSRLPVKKS